MARVYGERQAKPIQAETVSDGPVKEVVLKGDAVDLSALPIPFHNELDAGPYITGGVMILKDPDSGAQNAGLYRHQVHDPRTLGVYIQGSHHGGYIYRRNSERGEPTEFALVVGHYPTFMLGAVSRLPGIGGEFAEAGALLQEPISLVKAETVDLMVPAHAEIVIEGRLLPDETRLEGPFGEWTGYYVSVGAQPVMHVSAMTMRRDPIYYDVFPAGQEHLVLGSLPRMGTIYRRVREAVPGVINVNVPAHARTHCYISIRKTRDSEVKRAAMAAISTEPENLRCVVVVGRRHQRVQRAGGDLGGGNPHAAGQGRAHHPGLERAGRSAAVQLELHTGRHPRARHGRGHDPGRHQAGAAGAIPGAGQAAAGQGARGAAGGVAGAL